MLRNFQNFSLLRTSLRFTFSYSVAAARKNFHVAVLSQCRTSSKSKGPSDGERIVTQLLQDLTNGQRTALAKGITLVETTNTEKKLQAHSLVKQALEFLKSRRASGSTSMRIGIVFL